MGLTTSNSSKAVKQSPSHNKAIFELNRQRDILQTYQTQLNAIILRETDIARKCIASGNKRRARLALRKKKYQEQLLDNSEKQLLTLLKMASSIEYAQLEAILLEGTQLGNKALADLHNETSIEKVEKIMEETAEAIAYQKEIDEMLGTKLSEEDEEAVLAELAEIEAEKGLPSDPTLKRPPNKLASRQTQNQHEGQWRARPSRKHDRKQSHCQHSAIILVISIIVVVTLYTANQHFHPDLSMKRGQ